MRFCIECGNEVPEESKFCAVCGTAIFHGVGTNTAPTPSSPPKKEATQPVQPQTTQEETPKHTANQSTQYSFELKPHDNSTLFRDWLHFMVNIFSNEKKTEFKSKLASDFSGFQRSGGNNLLVMKNLKRRARILEFLLGIFGIFICFSVAMVLCFQPYCESFGEFIKYLLLSVLYCLPIVIPVSFLNLISRSSTGDFLGYEDEEGDIHSETMKTILSRNYIFLGIIYFFIITFILWKTYAVFSLGASFWVISKNFIVMLCTATSFISFFVAFRWWMLLLWFPVGAMHLIPLAMLVLDEETFQLYLMYGN